MSGVVTPNHIVFAVVLVVMSVAASALVPVVLALLAASAARAALTCAYSQPSCALAHEDKDVGSGMA